MTWLIDYQALQEMVVTEEDSSIVGNLHQRLEILRGYKRAFLKPGILKAVFAVLLKPLEVEYRLRTTRDQAVIRLGLSLFRNLVAISDTEASISGTMEQFIGSIMQVRKKETGYNSLSPTVVIFLRLHISLTRLLTTYIVLVIWWGNTVTHRRNYWRDFKRNTSWHCLSLLPRPRRMASLENGTLSLWRPFTISLKASIRTS